VRHREHEQPVGNEPERRCSEEPGAEGLSQERLQGAAQTGGLVRQ
jgi:hypothetical protein